MSQDIFFTPSDVSRKRKKGVHMTPSPSADNKHRKYASESNLNLDSQNLVLHMSPENQEELVDGNNMNHENSEGIITDSREIINQSEDQNRDELEDVSESEYICSVCQNKAEMNTIECEGCQEWFHAGCVDLSLGNMKAFGSLKGKARWFCKTCDERVKKSFQKVEKGSRDRKESNQENQIASYLENMDVQIDTIDCTTSEAIKYIDKRTKNMFEAYEHNFMEILDVFKRDLTDLENKIDEQSNNSLANKMNKLHNELAELKGKLNAKVYTNNDILEKNGDNLGPNGPNNMSRKGSKEGSEKEHKWR